MLRTAALAALVLALSLGLLRRPAGGGWRGLYEEAYAAYMTDCWAPELLEAAPESGASSPPAADGRVHVVYSSTSTGSNYLGLLGSMLSLARHLSAPERCSIHLLALEDELEDAGSLVECFRRELAAEQRTAPTVHLRELRQEPQHTRMKRLPAMSLGVNSPHSLARLRLHEYLPPDAARAVWLDHDTLVTSDIEPLFRVRMTRPLAAAYEPRWARWSSYLRFLPQLPESLRRDIADPAGPVFNIGVLVYDLARWRAENISERCEAWYGRVGEAVKTSPFLQLALNFAFQRGVDVLDWRWNLVGMPPYSPPLWFQAVLPLDRPPELCLSEARILHWAANREKPWESDRPDFKRFYPACPALSL